MLVSSVHLSALWFIISFIPLILFGTRIKKSYDILSIIWLGLVLVIGDYFIPGIGVINVVAIISGIFWIIFLRNWNFLAKVTWIFLFLVTCTYLIYSFSITAFATANILGFILALIFFFVEASSLLLSLTYAFEALDTLCRTKWLRQPVIPPPLPHEPKVSLHLPSYNEPPDVVIKTLENIKKLHYRNYEVLVIDNNTPDEATWRPLEEACHRLGPQFKFFHISNWPGYKSGALNFALSVTSPDAEFVTIIDADYHVNPEYLTVVTSLFTDSQIAFVQTPQDYRYEYVNSFFRSAYWGYKYFFNVSMPSRNERNAIIFAGTMGIIRKSVLDQIGGWDEWCITEDAEASLRILKLGYSSVYLNRSYGQGLMPLTFDQFKKQRFRWCFGGIQILKKHWQSLLPWADKFDPDNHLTLAQRYYYLVGGLQWYNDLLNLFFVFFLILGGVLNLMPQIQGFRPYTSTLIILPAAFLLTGLWRFLWVLQNALKLSWADSLLAMANFFSLGWAVTLGSIQGLIQKQGVFLRTPKVKSNLKFLSAIGATQSELTIGLICIAGAVTFIFLRLNILTIVLGIMLVWEGMLFISAPVYSVVSTREITEAESYQYPGRGVTENVAAQWLVLGLAVIGVFFFVVRLTPPPSRPAPYSRLQPQEVIPLSPAPTAHISPAPTQSLSPTPTGPTPTAPTPTGPSPTATITPSISITTTPSVSITPVPTTTSILSPTASPSATPSVSISPTGVVSPTASPSATLVPTM